MSRRRRIAHWQPSRGQPRPRANHCRWLLVIDNRPLQAAAWAELARARKRLAKATRDVHRHEEVDEPAHRAWLTGTFPVRLSELREMAEKAAGKIQLVEAIEHESYFTGRPAYRIWHEWQQHGGRPPPAPPDEEVASRPEGDEREPPPIDSDNPFADEAEAFGEELKRMFAQDGFDPDDPQAAAFGDFARRVFGFNRKPPPSAEVSITARDAYRRLVRQLHPDCGGEWTPLRARLWEQVQTAWAAQDADWLARLEAEWDAHTDRLSVDSPVGRLRAALQEIDAARRDAEKRVRQYRKQDAWCFSLKPVSEMVRRQTQQRLQRDAAELRRQLAELEAVIAGWERAAARIRPKKNRDHPRQAAFEF